MSRGDFAILILILMLHIQALTFGKSWGGLRALGIMLFLKRGG